MRPHLDQWLDIVAPTCHPRYVRKYSGRSKVQTGPGEKQDLISKVTKAKSAGGEAHVEEGLPRNTNSEFNPQYCRKK
jgi:hypothetical protein